MRKLWFRTDKRGDIDLEDPRDPTPDQIEAGRAKELVVEIDEIRKNVAFGVN
jgi:hypothetical protein